MASGGKRSSSWWSRTKTTAEHEPMPQPYTGQPGDRQDQLPASAWPAAREALSADEWPAPEAAWPMPARPELVQPMPVRPTPARPGHGHSAPRALPPSLPLAAPVVIEPSAAAAQSQAHWQRDRMRAVIGDNLRVPTMLCEFIGCVSRFTHPDALGERDLRDRALAAGWQYDLIGRLACPTCVAHAPTFWTRHPDYAS